MHRLNPLRLLNSVIFGISLMVLLALYVSLGSGFATLREYFDTTELQFFNAWPMQVLMVLLVLNLATVTWRRIPFTTPRLGVWMIHTGIVVLVAGMFTYFSLKVEGLTFVPLEQSGAGWTREYYDSHLRALHARVLPPRGVRAPAQMLDPAAMPSLPRFAVAAPAAGTDHRLDRRDLREVRLGVSRFDAQNQQVIFEPLHNILGVADPITVDILAYYPYAGLSYRYDRDPASPLTAVRLTVAGQPAGGLEVWLCGDDPGHGQQLVAERFELIHRHMAPAAAIATVEAATRMHRINVQVGDHAQSLWVELGKTYAIGDTGYSLEIEEFDPAFPATDGQAVELLTMMVRTPSQQFRRQLISGRDTVTDWLLNQPGAGPMGVRQRAALDAAFQTIYTFADPMELAPTRGQRRFTIITLGDERLPVIIEVGRDGPGRVRAQASSLTLGVDSESSVELSVERIDQVRRTDRIVPTPKEKRQRDEAGLNQVLLARIRSGSWERLVPVVYTEWAREGVGRWLTEPVELPGNVARLQLALGQMPRPLPRWLKLIEFQAVKYPGGTDASQLMRDFRSHIRMREPRSGAETTGIVELNSPVSFDGWPLANWTLFQAQWDPSGQRWTILGVGNRPGVLVMLMGSVLMAVGLIYAFYIKPIIIRRMKQQALERAGRSRAASTPMAMEGSAL